MFSALMVILVTFLGIASPSDKLVATDDLTPPPIRTQHRIASPNRHPVSPGTKLEHRKGRVQVVQSWSLFFLA